MSHIFSITNRCNLDCKGCYQKEFHALTEHELSPEKLKEITHEAHKLGIYFFVIAGGEPLSRPELLEITQKYPEILFLDYTPIQEETKEWALLDHQRTQVMSLMKSFRRQFSALFISVPLEEMEVGGCLSAGRGFVHINAEGDVEPCPFAPISDTNLKESSLKEALQSEFLLRIRQIPELSKYTGEGCALWRNREQVRSLLHQE
ncbi:MAG: 4Fe-4S cluster-binding domain-containing protein [Candidatus Aminicenantes bacterium]|nr:4Fe-4S cluster-binding domain-containing protein [Candidatus Aminicenantes bacterium]